MANPLLEAFGNARTEANANSSRFGKRIVLNYDQFGKFHSTKIETHLLELSRLTSRNGANDHNFHIFY